MTHEKPTGPSEAPIRSLPTAREVFLRCIACRWGAAELEGKPPETYSDEISDCSGKAHGAFSAVLREYVDIGAVTTMLEDSAISKREGRAPKKFISPSTTPAGIAFQRSLQVPSHCGLEDHPTGETAFTFSEARVNRQTVLTELLEASSNDDLVWVIGQAAQLLASRET